MEERHGYVILDIDWL